MKNKHFLLALAVAMLIATSMLPAADTKAKAAFLESEAYFEKAAGRCIGEICEKNSEAYVLYLYDETQGVSDACMYGITKALASCDHAVSFSGLIGIKNKEDLEEKTKNIVFREVEVTHILTDALYIKEYLDEFFSDRSKTVFSVCIPHIYSKSGL